MPTVLDMPLELAQGKVKSFGVFGPKYEVGNALRRLVDGDWMARIKLVETGEEAEVWFRLIL